MMLNDMTCNSDDSFEENGSILVGRTRHANAAPIYYGLEHEIACSEIKLVKKSASELNQLMASGELDISPVSAAMFAYHSSEWVALPNLSIACSGPMMSARLFAQKPLHQLDGKTVVLPSESLSSAFLVKLMCIKAGVRPRFEVLPVYLPEDVPRKASAVLVVGDEALFSKWDTAFPYAWEMGRMWQEKTGLPFVFSLWAVRRSFARKNPDRVLALMALMYMSLNEGISNMHRIVENMAQRLNLSRYTCRQYFKTIEYGLDAHHQAGLDAFFDALYQNGLTPRRASLGFFDPHAHLGQQSAVDLTPADLYDLF